MEISRRGSLSGETLYNKDRVVGTHAIECEGSACNLGGPFQSFIELDEDLPPLLEVERVQVCLVRINQLLTAPKGSRRDRRGKKIGSYE